MPDPQRNAELVKLQEEAAARQEGERLRVEQQIQVFQDKSSTEAEVRIPA